jgi:hypothetical protein
MIHGVTVHDLPALAFLFGALALGGLTIFELNRHTRSLPPLTGEENSEWF